MKIKTLLFFSLLFASLLSMNAQDNIANDSLAVTPKDSIENTAIRQDSIIKNNIPLRFISGRTYELGGISVSGVQKFSENAVKVFTGLKTGQKIKLPGDKLTSAIKKLYDQKQFSNVEVYVTKIDGDVVYLEFEVVEMPQLNSLTFQGVRKSKAKELREDTGLKMGTSLTENLLVTSKNYIKKYYQDKGFLNTKVNIITRKDTALINADNMLIRVDKGKKVKIKKINIVGNEKLGKKKITKAMKNTKKKFFGRFWKGSKYIRNDFETDMKSIVEKYREQGYRDMRITYDSISKHKNNKDIEVHIGVEEGKRYYFGHINFLGNTVYTDEQLKNHLRIDRGQVYNAKVLNDRATGDGSAESDDIATLYQNNGYIFSTVNVVETKVQNDSIYVEIRINEDEQATLRAITVKGNDRTNDHVIYRQLRTRPGYLYRKEDIIRSIRELGQLGFFDPESITPDLKPNYYDKTVDIEYSVEEKGSSQIELQGGYGGGSFIGTLGLSFNNFSLRNIFNLKSYQPLPMGDGQALSLRLQKSRYYTTTSFSFTEPWLGGKKPQSLSVSFYYSQQFRYNFVTRDVDRDQRLNIIGTSVSLGRRLKWPDDYFTLSQTISVQHYNLNNFQFGRVFDFSTGEANNISYGIDLTRNSEGANPIFPTYGSTFKIGLKATLPYSLLGGEKDYENMTDQEKYKWLEYYKVDFQGRWFTSLVGKLVLMSNAQFGVLGYYNEELGYSPFERYYMGGDGMQTFQLDGRETIGLRGYENSQISSVDGDVIYNRIQFELRYPLTLKPAASIYMLAFAEGGNSYSGFEDFTSFNLKRSAGAGVRVFMPAFGLLGIDFGYGFDPAREFLPVSGWQTHFIIGQQF